MGPVANHLRQRIAVVDPCARTREYMRRAIRGLGHAPLVFTEVDELLCVERGLQRCKLMCFGLPPDGQHLRELIAACREIVGPEVPIMFVASPLNSRALKELGRIRPNEMLATPSSFAEVYNALEGFMIRHRLPLSEEGLVWGPYRFFPACALVTFSGTEVWLNAAEFELALEFFHNIGRPLSLDWLRSMVPKSSSRGWARWLDTKVEALRHQLALEGCAPGATPWTPIAHPGAVAYRLTSIAACEPSPPGFAIERFEEA